MSQPAYSTTRDQNRKLVQKTKNLDCKNKQSNND